MKKRRWLLLIFILIFAVAYIKFFYKTYSNKLVAKNADSIIAIDVKRIINTSIFNVITTPSQWSIKDVFKKSNKQFSWIDMINLPDYILIFHVQNQPIHTWYVVLQIKNTTDFEKGLQQYRFIKTNENIFESKTNGIKFLRNGNAILVTNALAENNNYLIQTAAEIFTKNQFIDNTTLNKVIKANSHLSVVIKANSFLQEDAVFTANFDKTKIKLQGAFLPKAKYQFTQNSFAYNDTALCSLGCTQPSDSILSLWNESDKNKLSTLIGLNLDATILKSNKYYCLNIITINTKTDSAITYSYDDDFNKVAHVGINNIQEPIYNFLIAGDSVNTIYHNWLHEKKIVETPKEAIFTPMPLVKSYCKIDSNNKLNICTYNYWQQNNNTTSNCVLYINLNAEKLPDNIIKYLPTAVIKMIHNFKLLQFFLNNKNGKLVFNSVLFKKNSDLAIINW